MPAGRRRERTTSRAQQKRVPPHYRARSRCQPFHRGVAGTRNAGYGDAPILRSAADHGFAAAPHGLGNRSSSRGCRRSHVLTGPFHRWGPWSVSQQAVPRVRFGSGRFQPRPGIAADYGEVAGWMESSGFPESARRTHADHSPSPKQGLSSGPVRGAEIEIRYVFAGSRDEWEASG